MDIGWGSLNLFDKAVFITIKMDFKAVGGFHFACAVFFTDVGSFVISGIVGMFAFFSSFVFGFNDTGINDANTACFDDDILLG